MTISLLVAVAENGVIGHKGGMPWRLPSDLRRFRRLTLGHHVIMGRKTFASIGRPLPGRKMVVLTRQNDYQAVDARIAASWEDALAIAQDDSEVFVIGGAEIFRLALPCVNRIYRTMVHDRPEGDTFFPSFDETEWRVVSEQRIPAGENNSADTTFQVLERTTQPTKVTMSDATHELLELSARLLESIQNGDWSAYEELCDPTISAFEPEARGHLVEGLEFHQFYFNLKSAPRPTNNTISSPHVRLIGKDAAVVSYVRLVQTVDDAGRPVTRHIEETRVWERRDGRWRHVHFHRSLNE